MKTGFGLQVEDGKFINIKECQWGFKGLSGSSLLPNLHNMRWNFVWELWSSTGLTWDRGKVIELYGFDIGNKICEISIIKEGLVDRMIWFHTPQGVYSMKFGYTWLVLQKAGFGLHRNFWCLI